MLFTLASAALIAASNALVLPRQANTTTPTPSGLFKVHARCAGRTDFQDSPGYLFAEYAYPPGYYATFRTGADVGITGYLTDATNPSNSSLQFPNGGYEQGFKLYTLSQQYPNSIAQIYSGQTGTKGMYVDGNGLLQWQSPDGAQVSWEICPGYALEWGPATALKYKLAGSPTEANCFDGELVVEYQ